MASFHLPLQSYEMLWLFMCCLSTTSTGQDCEVSNGEVRVSSTMNDDNPQPYPVEKGSNVTLTCTASFKAYRMRWYVNVKTLKKECTKSPVETCKLTLQRLDVGGNYTCQATKSNSNTCIIKKLELKVADGRKPTIIKAPVNQSAHIGSNVTFNCTVRGDPAPAVNWTKDGNLLPFNQKVLTNLTTVESQLVIRGVRMNDTGKYRCVASNSMGTEKSRAAALLVFDDRIPTIVKAPVNQSAYIGSNVTFNCTVSGDPAPAINWTKDGNLLPFNQNVLTNLTTGESQLVITGVRNEDGGKYRCVASNRVGRKESKAAVLSLMVVPEGAGGIPTIVQVPAGNQSPHIGVEGGTGKKEPSSRTILIVGLCLGVLALVTCVVIGLLRYRRSRRAEETNHLESSSLAMEGLNEGSAISPYDTENISGITDAVREEDRVQLLVGHATEIASVPRQSDGEFSVNLPRSQLMTQDSAYDSGGSQESVSLEHDNAFDGESVILKEHEESWEIDMKRLKVTDIVLGEGEFGVVKRGTYRGLDGRTCNVAVKQLKDGTSITDRGDLLWEIQMLKQAGWHPNIVALIGACTQDEEILVVTELIPNGSLEKFLKSKRMVGVPGQASTYENVHFGLNDRELLVIAYQIALGMQHLEEKKCIHRDLSARNVFIGENLVAKVGDFGLARDISFDGIYTKKSSGRVPWRWMALESLKDHVYTSKSDVWSYGIVLWEIATCGEVPYPNILMLADLIIWLSMGNRMSRPEHSSDELYEMMRSCWLENPLMRPTFAEITKRFQYYLREYKRKYVNVTDDGSEKAQKSRYWMGFP